MSTSDSTSERREEPRLSTERHGSGPPPPVVTVASYYGAGGTIVAPRVAERLGVPFLDRAIPAAVARRAGVPEAVVAEVDERTQGGRGRLIESLARVTTITDSTGSVERLDVEERRMRTEIDEFLVEASVSGGVVLGRAAAVVLASVPGALHVLLMGQLQARIERTMELEGVDRKTAERLIQVHMRARNDYVTRTYGVQGEDPSLYHLLIDTMALGFDESVDLIVSASEYRIRRAVAALQR